jgi:hypothetical protein
MGGSLKRSLGMAWRGHLALVFFRWQDASGTQGRDGLATSAMPKGSAFEPATLSDYKRPAMLLPKKR